MEFLKSYQFTETDRQLLKMQIPFIDCQASMFGDNCEIVLHSFESLHSSVIHIVNGHITGREVGAPVTNIALEKLSKFCESDDDWEIYFSNRENGKHIFKSSSTLIKNFENIPIGMICMNYTLDISIYNFMKGFFDKPNIRKSENFSKDVNDLIISHLEPIKTSVYSDSNIPSKSKVSEIVKRLHNTGLFEMSITTKIVSNELGISTAAIYKHLRNINVKNKG